MKVVMVYFLVQYVQGNTDGPVCGPGRYRSEYIGGGCVGCPVHWTFCQNEAAEDIKSCEDACGKVSQTTTLPPEPPLVTVTTIDVGNVTTGATSYTADTGQHETSSVTVQPTFSAATIDVGNVTTGTIGATSDTTITGQHETSSSGDWVYILIAIFAGLIFVVFLFCQCFRRVKELDNADEENNMQELNSLNHSSNSSSLRVGGIQESSCSSLLSKNRQEPESV